MHVYVAKEVYCNTSNLHIFFLIHKKIIFLQSYVHTMDISLTF